MEEIRKGGFWQETLQFILASILIIMPIRFFVAQPFVVSGQSMSPTFENGEYLIVDELSYYLSSPSRGDVIIFKYPRDMSKYFIKRIVGLPGETIEIRDQSVLVTPVGTDTPVKIDEPYITGGTVGSDAIVPIRNDEYFVMGDNRGASSDSRSWGNLPKKLITGRALLRLYPPKRIEYLPGKNK